MNTDVKMIGVAHLHKAQQVALCVATNTSSLRELSDSALEDTNHAQDLGETFSMFLVEPAGDAQHIQQ